MELNSTTRAAMQKEETIRWAGLTAVMVVALISFSLAATYSSKHNFFIGLASLTALSGGVILIAKTGKSLRKEDPQEDIEILTKELDELRSKSRDVQLTQKEDEKWVLKRLARAYQQTGEIDNQRDALNQIKALNLPEEDKYSDSSLKRKMIFHSLCVGIGVTALVPLLVAIAYAEKRTLLLCLAYAAMLPTSFGLVGLWNNPLLSPHTLAYKRQKEEESKALELVDVTK